MKEITRKTMYRISSDRYDIYIEEFLITKETDKSVWFSYLGSRNSHRELKQCDSHRWFNTKEQAFEYKRKELLLHIDARQKDLDYANENLNKFYNKYKDLKRHSILDDILK